MKAMKRIKQAVGLLMEGLRHRREARYLLEASRLYKEAVDEAEMEHAKYGWRYHVVWDEARRGLICLTYEFHEGHWNSYWHLRQRGRFKAHISIPDFKALCFYYTASRWKPKCSEREQREKMVEFQKFYVKRMMKHGVSRINHGSKGKLGRIREKFLSLFPHESKKMP
jgi:hypothetical protein